MEKSATLITIPVRFSYLKVFSPEAFSDGNGEKPKYTLSALIPKSDKVTVDKIKAAIEAAKASGVDKLGAKPPANLQVPLRDGDIDRPDDEAYKGHWFFNCSSVSRPGVVNKDREPIIDPEEFSSGDYGFLNVNFFAFNFNNKKGIAAGLNHVMKTRDGAKLAGKISVEEAFSEIEDLLA